MSMKMFAAIDVGSYELNMKIFEFNGGVMREVDSIGYRLDLGTDTFSTGRLPMEKVNELCRILREFAAIMKSYHVNEYRAYGTSAIRETKNNKVLLDQIEQRSGIHIDIISNSEQRFLDYKSIVAKASLGSKIATGNTAIIDIGGGSIQVSLFDKDRLDVTLNMKLGVLRLKERLAGLVAKPSRHEELLDEMIVSQLSVFGRLYLKNRKIDKLIIVDDYVSPITLQRTIDSDNSGLVSAERFEAFTKRLKEMNQVEFARKYSVATENIPLVFISAAIIRNAVAITGAETIWCPGVTLTDGMAYEYGEQKKLLTSAHDFEEDIIACAKCMAARYMGDEKRSHTLEKICLTIFDSMKKVHGMSERDRLLLRIATILHDCGKYVSLYNLATCSYDIIMATEIIGLSHEERSIIANVVKFNHMIEELAPGADSIAELREEAYMKIAKMTAILRLANGLDKSQKQKFGNIKATLKDNTLTITVKTNKDITYERGMFLKRTDFFEEIFCIKPEINHISKI